MLDQVFGDILREFQARLWTALPARVQTFYGSEQAVDVEPLIKDSEYVLPVLPRIPVVYPRGGGLALSFPIGAGDTGLVVFSTLSLDDWRSNAQVQTPTDIRRHSLTGGVFFPGLVPGNASLTADPTAMRLGSTSGPAQYIALANLVQAEFTTLKTALVAAFNAVGAGLAANGASGAASLTSGYTPGSVASSDVKAT